MGQTDIVTAALSNILTVHYWPLSGFPRFRYLFIYLFVEKVHMKATKQMTLQLDRKVHDSNTCQTLKHKNTLKYKNTNIGHKNMSNMRLVRH